MLAVSSSLVESQHSGLTIALEVIKSNSDFINEEMGLEFYVYFHN